jgi:hypothetical protein
MLDLIISMSSFLSVSCFLVAFYLSAYKKECFKLNKIKNGV